MEQAYEVGQQNWRMRILLRDWAFNSLTKRVILYEKQPIQGWNLECTD